MLKNSNVAIAISVQRTAEDWRRIIADDLSRAVEGIVAAGRHLQEAKDELPHGEFGPLLESLRLHERTAQRLMKIAANEILANPTHGSHLPISWRTLSELAALPPKLLEAKIADGTITPEIERKDVAALKGKAPAAKRLAVDDPDPPASKAPIAALAKEVEASRAHAEELETAREADAEELHRLRRENIALQSEVAELKAERDQLREKVAELEAALAGSGAMKAERPKRGRPKGSKNKPKVAPAAVVEARP
jgi:hypothetical protein